MKKEFNKFYNLNTFVLGTSDEHNQINMRTIHGIEIDNKFYIMSSKDTIKVSEFMDNPHIALYNLEVKDKDYIQRRLYGIVKPSKLDINKFKNKFIEKYHYDNNVLEKIFDEKIHNLIFEIVPKYIRISNNTSDFEYNYD